MRQGLLCSMIGLCLVPGAAWSGSPADPFQIRGKWEVVERELLGKKSQPGDSKFLVADVWEFSAGKISRTTKNKSGDPIVNEWKYRLDPSKLPKEIDLVPPATGKFTPKSIKGIYEFDGDQLKICYTYSFSKAGTTLDRPTTFANKEGTPVFLLILKRKQ